LRARSRNSPRAKPFDPLISACYSVVDEVLWPRSKSRETSVACAPFRGAPGCCTYPSEPLGSAEDPPFVPAHPSVAPYQRITAEPEQFSRPGRYPESEDNGIFFDTWE
jgi:hypothetical protein